MNQQQFEQWIRTRGYYQDFEEFVAKYKLSFDDYSTYSEAQWERGLDFAGVSIYNALHRSKK